MSTDIEDHILRIKHLVYCSMLLTIQIGAIDALAAYGRQAINAITEIINCPGTENQVKAHAIRTIENIKKGTSTTSST